MKRTNKIMTNKNKKDLEKNLEIIASFCSPVVKAWIYTFATIGVALAIIAGGILSFYAHSYKLAWELHLICPLLQFIFLTIQQKFNGENWRTIVKARRDKKAKKAKEK